MVRVADVLRSAADISLAWRVPEELAFRSVTNDSRLARPGSLFVAVRGERDGHDFVADAYARGARGVIGERLIDDLDWLPESARRGFAYFIAPSSLDALHNLASYWRGLHPVRTVGITGSVGKTTVKELTAGVLAGRYRVLKNEKNYNNEIGLPLSLLRLHRGHEVAVLEMGMYSVGEIAALCRVARPEIGVVVNVGPTHLERLGSIERIAQAKSELVQALPATGLAILNGDDERVQKMAGLAKGRVATFGIQPHCDFRATDVVSRGLRGIEFTAVWRDQSIRISTRMLGKHSVYPCLAALAVGLEMGLSPEEAASRLKRPPQQSRLALLKGPSGSIIIDDTYNASPVSVIAALDLLSETRGRRVAILGDMLELGEYEEAAHREVGRKAARSVDVLIAVGERARWIADEARSAGLSRVRAVASRAEVELSLEKGDVVLVKGSRGMRMEEVVARLMGSEGARTRA